ncbi:MAG: tetratricopeptide repeat protein [Chloroflexota bacterium]|nr:tetratricopeptide repeat protein [Chloroflexota bacterium]
MKKMTRSQIVLLIVLGVLTVAACGCLVSILVLNSQEIAQLLVPAPTTSPLPSPSPPSQAETEEPTFAPTATASPTPAPTLPPTPSPTSISTAPQTSYDTQVADEPENPTLRLQRGYAYIEMGAYIYAIGDFDVAIGLDETLAEPYLGRGEARFHTREWRAALEDLDQALALNPDLADAHAWRGYLLSERREYELAIEALRQAVALDEMDPVKRIRLAEALLNSGSHGEAEREYSVSLSLSSPSVEAYIGRAMAQAALGDLDAAQVNLSHAMSTAPLDPVALNGRAWFYAQYQQDRLYEASQLAQQAVAGARDDLERARYLHTLGWIYYQQGYRELAVTTLEEAVALATVEGEVVYSEILARLEEVRAAQ